MSEARLAPQPWMHAQATLRVIAALDAEDAAPRFVGGCVRDALAGRPVKDIDIATPLPPEEVTRRLKAASLKVVPTGLAHGTVTAVAEHKPFEITTLRVDVETYGRHAKVAFTDDWVADAARRDFTINALSCAPDGTLYDPFGGVADLRAGHIRFVGDARARIREDYLRLLRYFRFHAHYGRGAPDAETLSIIAQEAEGLHRLSGERVRDEILKLLGAPDPVPVVEIMIARNVLQQVLPLATGTPDAPTILRAVLRAETPEGTPEGMPEDAPDPLVRLAALVEPDGVKADAAAKRLRLSNKDRRALIAMAQPDTHINPHLPPRDRWRALRKLGVVLYREVLRLDWARRHAGDDAVPSAAYHHAVDESEELVSKNFPLRGADILKLGVPTGPRLGELLDQAETWWAETGFTANRKACLDYLKGLIGTA